MEKQLKALLVALELHVPKTHDLDALLAIIVPLRPQLSALSNAASFLNGFSVVPRYPSFLPFSAQGDDLCEKALALARLSKKVVEEVLSEG